MPPANARKTAKLAGHVLLTIQLTEDEFWTLNWARRRPTPAAPGLQSGESNAMDLDEFAKAALAAAVGKIAETELKHHPGQALPIQVANWLGTQAATGE